MFLYLDLFFFSSRRRHTRYWRDWSSDVCSSDLEEDHLAKGGAAVADLADHRAVVAGLELRRAHQHRDAGLLQHVGQLVGPVGRVDVDQDRAELGRRVLDEGPLRTVGRPDADPVALVHTERVQPEGDRVDPGDELRVGEAATGGALDERLVVAHPRRRPVQVRPDRVPEEGDGRGATAVGRQRGLGHALPPRCRPPCRGPGPVPGPAPCLRGVGRTGSSCELRGAGGSSSYSPAWTPARFGLSVGWAYRRRWGGSGKSWSSPKGDRGPADSARNSVTGAPPSSDTPQVGSIRWSCLGFRLAMSPCPPLCSSARAPPGAHVRRASWRKQYPGCTRVS